MAVHRLVYERHVQIAKEMSESEGFGKLVEKYRSEIESDRELSDDGVKACMFMHLCEQGVDPVFAKMHACRRASGSRGTDRAFNQGQRRRMTNMDAYNRDKLLEIAKKAGINTSHKFYCGGLGRPNDPAAWVSTDSDVLEVARKRNLEVTGPVEHSAVYVPDPDEAKPLAEDIIQDRMSRILSKNPAVAEKYRKNPKKVSSQLRDKIVETHGRQ